MIWAGAGCIFIYYVLYSQYYIISPAAGSQSQLCDCEESRDTPRHTTLAHTQEREKMETMQTDESRREQTGRERRGEQSRADESNPEKSRTKQRRVLSSAESRIALYKITLDWATTQQKIAAASIPLE